MWLSEEGPTSRKHKGFIHPVVTFIVHYISVINIIIFVHDALIHSTTTTTTTTTTTASIYLEKSNIDVNINVNNNENGNDSENNNCIEYSIMIKRRQQYIACFLALYFCICLCVRLALQWKNTKQQSKQSYYKIYCEFYRMTFLCNVTIINVSISFFYNRPIIAQSFCLAVGIDQFLWYIDLIGYFIWGTFPAGVCKYLLRNNWISRITSCHHLWTIPLVFWGCGGVFHWLAVPLSGIIIILNVLLSRWMTPISIENLGDEDDEKYLYLNINLSHEMWEDVKFFNPNPDMPYLFRLIFWWFSTNVAVFAALCGISYLLSFGSVISPNTCVY